MPFKTKPIKRLFELDPSDRSIPVPFMVTKFLGGFSLKSSHKLLPALFLELNLLAQFKFDPLLCEFVFQMNVSISKQAILHIWFKFSLRYLEMF